MGIIKNLVNAIREQDREREELDDSKTTDRYLRSLRRQYRIILEEKEKEELKRLIKENELSKTRESFLGTNYKEMAEYLREKIAEKRRNAFIKLKKPNESMLRRGNL